MGDTESGTHSTPSRASGREKGVRAHRNAVFIGTEVKSLDAKGRLVIPSKFRRNAGFDGEEGFYATPGPGPFLMLFTVREWDRLTGKVLRSGAPEGNVLESRHLFFPEAEFLPLDGQGRIVLSPAHVAETQLGESVAVLGMGDHLEIWEENAWKAYREERRSRRDDALWKNFLS